MCKQFIKMPKQLEPIVQAVIVTATILLLAYSIKTQIQKNEKVSNTISNNNNRPNGM